MTYAKNFGLFEKEVLRKIVLDLLLVFDKLVFASVAAAIIGSVAGVKGFINLDVEYTFAGAFVVCIGFFFGKLKIDNIKYAENRKTK